MKRLLAALLCTALSVGGPGSSVPAALAQVVETVFHAGAGVIRPLPGASVESSVGGLGLGVSGSGVTPELPIPIAPALVRVEDFARSQDPAAFPAPRPRADGLPSAGPNRIVVNEGRPPEELVGEGSGRFDGVRSREEGAAEIPASSAAQPPASPFRLRAVSFARNPLPEVLPLPPGTLDRADYRVPRSITVARGLMLAGHAGGAAAAVVLLAVGLGWAPLAMAALVGWRQVHREPKDDGMSTFSGMLRGREREQMESYGRRIVAALVGRLGLDVKRTPILTVSNDHGGAFGATSIGKAIDDSARLMMGEGYASKPFQETAGVLAHELGHLFFNDGGGLGFWRIKFRMSFFTASVCAGLAVKLVLSACLSPALFLHPLNIGFAPILHLLVWVGLAFPVAWAAFLAGLAVLRQDEFRADHFSAWLTDPSWLIGHFQERIRSPAYTRSARTPKGSFGRWMDRLLSTHPADAERIRRLEDLRGHRKD